MSFVTIEDGREFSGELPAEVTLPIHQENYSKQITIKKGEPAWEESLERYMFLQGYIWR